MISMVEKAAGIPHRARALRLDHHNAVAPVSTFRRPSAAPSPWPSCRRARARRSCARSPPLCARGRRPTRDGRRADHEPQRMEASTFSRRTTPCPTGRGRAYPNHARCFATPATENRFALMIDGRVQSSVCRQGMLDILSLEIATGAGRLLRGAPGLLPGACMNKENWSPPWQQRAPDAQIRTLLAMSYDRKSPRRRGMAPKKAQQESGSSRAFA